MALVIETAAHRAEKAKVSSIASGPFRDAIHIGSTGIQAYLDNGPHNDLRISQRIAPTEDADIVLPHSEVAKIAAGHTAEITFVPLIARVTTKMGSRVHHHVDYEPFELVHLLSPHGPTNEFFKSIDIFTDQTRVGVIPVTNEVLVNGFYNVTLGEINVRVAKPFFLLATQMNPFARTEARSDRMLFVMVEAYQRLGSGFEAEVSKAVEYIGLGEERAHQIVVGNADLGIDAKPELMSRPEFAKYSSQVRQVGNLMGNQLKNKIASIARQLGLSTAEGNVVREIVADHFSSYETKTEMATMLRS